MDLTKLRVGCLWKMKVERALWFKKAKWSAQGATFHRMDSGPWTSGCMQSGLEKSQLSIALESPNGSFKERPA